MKLSCYRTLYIINEMHPAGETWPSYTEYGELIFWK